MLLAVHLGRTSEMPFINVARASSLLVAMSEVLGSHPVCFLLRQLVDLLR